MTNNTKKQNGIELKPSNAGFALVVTLLLMVSVSMIGLLALMNASTETLITRNEKEQKIAFQTAEAGLNEAYARVQLATNRANYMGYTTVATYNCGSTTCNFNPNWAGSSISAGAAVGGLTTGTYTVTVTYATENSDSFCKNSCTAQTEANETNNIVRFGQDFGFLSTMVPIPPANGYLPVYKMTSTGAYGNSTVALTSYVAASSLNTRTQGAIDSNSNATTCTPTAGLATSALCTSGAASATITGGEFPDSSYNLNTQLGDTISNIENMADEKHNCKNANCSSAGDDIPSSGAIDTVVTNWGDFAGDTSSTIIFIDNDNDSDYTNANTANSVKISGSFTGRGILVITGDLNLTGSFQYEGLVYVMGTLTVSGGGGGLNVTGGIISNKTVAVNGASITVTYDQATLDAVARESGGSAVVRWSRQ